MRMLFGYRRKTAKPDGIGLAEEKGQMCMSTSGMCLDKKTVCRSIAAAAKCLTKRE